MWNPFASKKKNLMKDLQDMIRIKESHTAFTTIAEETINLTDGLTKAIQNKISDYENQIESLSHMMSDALLMADENGRITSANDIALKLFDINEPSIKGISVITLFRLPEYFTFKDFIHQSIKTTPDLEEDFIVHLDENRAIYTDVSVASITKSDGSTYYIIIVRDITERIESWRKIYENEQRFKILEEVSMESLVIHNDHSIIDINNQFTDLTGYTRSEIIGSEPYFFIHQEDKLRITELEKTGKTGEVDFRIVTKDGDIVTVSMNTRLIPWAGETVRINLMHDVSIYKSRQELVEMTRDRYAKILNNSIDILSCYGPDRTITYVNHTFEEYFGLNEDEAIGRLITDFIPASDREMFDKNIKSINSRNPVRRSLYRIVINGKDRWQDCINRGIFDEKGNIVEYQAISRDVTNYLNARVKLK